MGRPRKAKGEKMVRIPIVGPEPLLRFVRGFAASKKWTISQAGREMLEFARQGQGLTVEERRAAQRNGAK